MNPQRACCLIRNLIYGAKCVLVQCSNGFPHCLYVAIGCPKEHDCLDGRRKTAEKVIGAGIDNVPYFLTERFWHHLPGAFVFLQLFVEPGKAASNERAVCENSFRRTQRIIDVLIGIKQAKPMQD